MVRSMTGYGKSEYNDGKVKLVVEIRSVNNRFLDFNIHMPKKFFPFEMKIRNLLGEYIKRGKIDVFISWSDYEKRAGSIRFNEALAGEYLDIYKKISAMDNSFDSIKVGDIARSPEVIVSEDDGIDEEYIWGLLSEELKNAAIAHREAKEFEGARLKDDILVKLEGLETSVKTIIEREPEIIEAYRTKLQGKLEEILEDNTIDEGRLAQEVVYYADKMSTDEEQVRLLSHIEKMRTEFAKDESIGKNLDFIVQELNRESNTILSKSGDVLTSDLAIGMKTDIEKIREQIQNIE